MTYSIFGGTWLLVIAEFLLVSAAVLVAFLAPDGVSRVLTPCERFLGKAARRPWLAVSLAIGAPLALRVMILPLYPPPSPTVHDDFSYLLQASTFAAGRVTNPTPPFWQHFESIFIFCTPTYNSQYGPAPGLFLAAGQILTGHPWWGAYAAMGLLFGALCWALAQCVPWRWALLGSLLAAMQFGVFGYWMNSYFGGAVAGIGGALILGGLVRTRKRHEAWAALFVALGLTLVAGSRPFEAILWGIGSIVFLVLSRPPLKMLIPGSLLLAVGAGALLWYNWRVTGHALEPPYLHNLRLYGTPQPFYWQKPVVISNFSHAELRDIYLYQQRFYQQRTSLSGLIHGTGKRLLDAWLFYVGPVLLLPLFWIPALWRDKRVRVWSIVIVLFLLDHLTFHRWYPQHSAPEAVLFCLILVECWRRLRLLQLGGKPVGRAITQLLPVCGCLSLMIPIMGKAVQAHLPPPVSRISALWRAQFQTDSERDRIIRQLDKLGGKHLIFVHYGLKHNPHVEWVYNGADIPGSRIIWARQVDPASDQALAAYFQDHKPWILDADSSPPHLVPFDQVDPGSPLANLRPDSKQPAL
jgi:hypothetical protein